MIHCMLTKNWTSIAVLLFLCHAVSGQTDWKFVEQASIDGSISGTITEGYIFKIGLRDFYIVDEQTRQQVRTRNPVVKIFQSGTDYRLEIQDFNEPVICKKLEEVIETQIDGGFKGWEGETIFKMRNGQIWQQSSSGYHYHHAYSPNVLIYKFRHSWIMKVEEVDETIEVRKAGNSGIASLSNSEVIETQINGEFKGWEGETIFQMKNGQIWQQSSYAYKYHYAYSPRVTIYKSGSKWEMKVEGVDGTIEVRKIK
jgi:hypothetical protein